MKKRIFASLLVGVMTVSVMAQISSTVSPYSQFGLGVLSDQSQGFNKGMGGLAMGLRGGGIINMQNPASYSAVDSLTMIFDLGISGQITNFKEGGKRVNGRTGSFDYGVGSFRLLRKVGVGFGIVPFSSIGYDYSHDEKVGTSSNYTSELHSGDGGFTQAFAGLGWEMMKGLSVGFNFSYFWGRYDKQILLASSDENVNTLTKSYSASVSSYKLDFGVQWQKLLKKYNLLTLGATVGIGHDLNEDAELWTSNVNVNSEKMSNDTMRVANAFSLPFSFGVGATWCYQNSLTAGFDYQLQKWGSLKYPKQNLQTGNYELMDGQLKDRHKVTLGVDWIPEPNPMMRRKFLKRIHYRLGFSYATPYYKIDTADGPKELGVSAGLGIPIINSWNNRSTLNISAQWIHSSAPNMVTENTFRINIGLTFNERWFAKWKVD